MSQLKNQLISEIEQQFNDASTTRVAAAEVIAKLKGYVDTGDIYDFMVIHPRQKFQTAVKFTAEGDFFTLLDVPQKPETII